MSPKDGTSLFAPPSCDIEIEVRMNIFIICLLLIMLLLVVALVYSKQEIKKINSAPKKIEKIEIEKIVEKLVPVEKIVEKLVEVPVEKIVEKIVEVEVEKILIPEDKARAIQPGTARKTIRKKNTAPKEFKEFTKKDRIDRMKRANVLPGNRGRVPVSYVYDHEKGRERKFLTLDSGASLSHKFFGTVLEIRGRVIVNGLPRKLHQLEILDGVAYIDGKEQKFHPNDIDALIQELIGRDE